MGRIVAVSNRIASPRESSAAAGGLAVALGEALQASGGLWFGWSGRKVPGKPDAPRRQRDGNVDYVTVDLNAKDYEGFYADFSNGTLWPLFHYCLGLIEFRRPAFEAYRRVNAFVAAELSRFLRPDDTIWVHDYHFMLLGAELRRLGVTNRIGFFLHIPFPAPEVLDTLPVHRQLMTGLCDYDLLGLQTDCDALAFRRYLVEKLGAIAGRNGTDLHAFGRRIAVDAFPIGIDAACFTRLAETAQKGAEVARLRESLGGKNLIIGVDRLDYSKGIGCRLEALEQLLAQEPRHHSKVTYLQIAPISRGEIARYRALRHEVETLAGRVNGRFAEFDWTPVRYLNKSFTRESLAGFYRASRVGLVTPLRDGMNLVAKEYVAAQDPADPGVLVLSRFAGAARELTDALIVNPRDIESTAEALHRALTMPREERIERWSRMMDAVLSNDVGFWRERFLARLAGVRSRQPVVHSGSTAGVVPASDLAA